MSFKENTILRSNWQVNLHSKCSLQVSYENQKMSSVLMLISRKGVDRLLTLLDHSALNYNMKNRLDAGWQMLFLQKPIPNNW